MTESGVAGEDVGDRYDCSDHPFVGPPAIKVGLGPLHGTGYFISAGWAVESECLVGAVGIADLHLIRRFRILPAVHLIGKPRLVPFVYAVVIGRVVLALAVLGNRSEILDVEHVQSRVLFQMDGIIVIICSVRSRAEQRQCFVEE